MRAVNFGCGLSVAPGWLNYDASPTLWLQRLPLLGQLAGQIIEPRFPAVAQYGDVVTGLPLADGSADLVYCSHVLEHLALQDLRRALAEVARISRPWAVFRGVLPDLDVEVRDYLNDPADDACSRFMHRTFLGTAQRQRGIIGLLRGSLGNSQHLWMWDFRGLQAELQAAGFVEIRRAEYGDSRHGQFQSVEDPARWQGALGFECFSPR